MSRRAPRGFTVLEAAVAVAIIGVSVVGVFRAFGAHLIGAERVRDHLTALALAEVTLSKLQLAGASDLALLPDSLEKGQFIGDFSEYHWTAHSVALAGERDLYEVEVVVEGSKARAELRTRIYRASARIVE